MPQPPSKQFTIREEEGKWCLYSKDGSKKLGCHDTEEGALAQERAIQARKHASVTREEMEAMCPDCAGHMKALGLTRISLSQLDDSYVAKIASEAYRREAAISPSAMEGLIDRIGRTDEGFRTRCMELMEGKVDDTGAFCNWLKQQMLHGASEFRAAEMDECPMGEECPMEEGMESCPKGKECAMAKKERQEYFEADFDEEGPSRTYLNAIRESLGGLVDADVWGAAMKLARAKAGGLFRGRKQRARKEDGTDGTATPPEEASTGQDGASATQATGTSGTALAGASHVEDRLQQSGALERGFAGAPADASSPGASPSATAASSERGSDDKTTGLGGPVGHRSTNIQPSASDLASWFHKTLHGNNLSRLCSSKESDGKRERGEWALFMPHRFAEEGEVRWIPYLPIPGEYESPKYGTILITPARNDKFVKNFKAGVYQKSLPIDAEHDLKTSGALGHIEDMRKNPDGSVDAFVRWTDRGRDMVKADRFRYVSPEWYDSWSDPMTGRNYADVAIGGALTTRPFFKERALRPLIASEKELDAWLGEETDPIRFTRKERRQMSILQKFVEMLGPDVKEEDVKAELKELVVGETRRPTLDAKTANERLMAAEGRLAAAEERADIAENRAREANERLATLEKDAQRKRFLDIVMGRTANSKNRWFGDEGKNVEKLVQLAEKLGENSKEFQEIISERIASANQVHQMLLSEHGSRVGIVEGGVAERVETAARELRETNPTLYPTIEKARVEVWRRNPDWKKEYREAQSRR